MYLTMSVCVSSMFLCISHCWPPGRSAVAAGVDEIQQSTIVNGCRGIMSGIHRFLCRVSCHTTQ